MRQFGSKARHSTVVSPEEPDECAVYVVSGDVRVDNRVIKPGSMAVAVTGKSMRVEADSAAKVSLYQQVGSEIFCKDV